MDESRGLVNGGDGEGGGEGSRVQRDRGLGGVGDEFVDVGRFVVAGRHLSMSMMGVKRLKLAVHLPVINLFLVPRYHARWRPLCGRLVSVSHHTRMATDHQGKCKKDEGYLYVAKKKKNIHSYTGRPKKHAGSAPTTIHVHRGFGTGSDKSKKQASVVESRTGE